MSSLIRVADNVIKNTTYLYYEKERGDFITDLTKYGYTKNIVPQNGYNDWKYWNGVIHIGFNQFGEMTGVDQYQNYTKKNFEFFLKIFPI